jgi:hypothetical protein
MTRDGPSLFAWSFPCSASLIVISFLLPRLHPSFLIILSCHLSTLRSCHFVGPSSLPFVLCLNDLFSQMISCWWGLIRPVDQDLSLHLAFLCIIWWDEDVTSCIFFSRQPLFDFHWLLVDEMLFIGACRLEFIHDKWDVSSFHKVIGVHHVPCFIFDLNLSHDLPKLNWEFPIGVSPTKYLVSTIAYYRLKNQPRHHV